MIAVLLIVVAVYPVYAEDADVEPELEYNVRFYAQVGGYNFYDPSRQEDGTVYGAGSVLDVQWNRWFTEIEGWFTSGDVNFHATAEDEHPGWDSTADNRVLNASIVAGRWFGGDSDFSIAPYFGVGVRDLNNDIHASAESFSTGYLKKRRYWYVPVGTKIELLQLGGFSLAADARFMWLLRGSESARLSDFSPELEDSSTTLAFGNGYGAYVALIFERQLPESGVCVGVRPFYRYWDLDRSALTTLRFRSGEEIGQSYDPAHTITELGIVLIVGFKL